MTEAAETQAETPAAPPTPPPPTTETTATPAAAEAVPEPQKTEQEKAAANLEEVAKKRQSKIADLREYTRVQAAARQAEAEARRAKMQLQAIEQQRQVDLARVKQAEEWERVKADPMKALEYLEANGLTAQQLVDAKLRGDSPERTIERIRAEFRREIEQERERLRQEQAQYESQRAFAHALQSFVGMVHSNEDTYPALTSLYTPEQIADEAREVVRQASERGYSYSDAEIADFLEQRARPRYNKIQERLKGAPPSGGTPKPVAASTTTATRAPAVTNGASSPESGLPTGFDSWSKADQDHYWTKLYEKLRTR